MFIIDEPVQAGLKYRTIHVLYLLA